MPTELVAAPSENSLSFISRPTPQLRAAIDRFEATLPPHDFADLLANVQSAFDKYTDKLLSFRPGAERASALHLLMDTEIKAASGVPTSCRQGCFGCCHYEVEITEDEAQILKAIVQEGFPIDHARLQEQAARARKSPEWNRFWSPKNLCVFQDGKGSCQVYEERPAICRKHIVVTPASACTTPGEQVAPVQVLLAEILLSAALSIEGTAFASLPKMLHAALQADVRRLAPDTWAGRAAARALPPDRSAPAVFAERPGDRA